MTIREQILAAKTPREAILILADELDRLKSAAAPADPWNDWGAEASVPPSAPVADPPRFKLTPEDVKAWIAANYGREPEDDAEGRAIIAQVKADLERSSDAVRAEDLFSMTDTGVVESEIDWTPQSDEHRAMRERFATEALQLDVALGETPPGEDRTWAQLYAQGGPMWLYIPNRDLLMQYPDQVKGAMVADVMRYSQKVAEEFAADVLKQPMQKDERSPAMAVSEWGVPDDSA